MRQTMMCIALAVICCATVAVAEDVKVSTPGFTVVDRGGTISVSYRDVAVVAGSRFEIAKPEWTGNVYPGRSGLKREVKQERRGEMDVVTSTWTGEGVGEVVTVVEVEPERVRIEYRYHLEASEDIGYIYAECFLDRELFDGAQYAVPDGPSGTLDLASGEGIAAEDLRSVDLTMPLGTLTMELTEQHGDESQPWEFRNLINRTWGPAELMTFSVPNYFAVTEPRALEGSCEYLLTLAPADDIETALADWRAGLDEKRERLATERAKVKAARQARIEAHGGVVLYPQPQEFERLDGAFVIDDRTRIVAGPDDRRAGERLAEELRDYFRRDVRVVAEGTGAGTIVIGRTGDPTDPGPEGYRLEARPDGVRVLGADERGAWYGVQALMGLLRWDGDALQVPAVSIRDWPDFRTRAMTLTLSRSDDMPFLRTTLRRVLPRMRINMIFVGGASRGRVAWPSHPEVGTEGAHTAEDIRELAELARENYIELVPKVQGLGHTGGLISSHPELLVDKSAGRTPCFDFTRPETQGFIFDLYQDAIDATRTERYFHVGFDEASGIQLIAEREGRPAAELVAEYITLVHDWLAERGLTMIMWSDMLLARETFGGTSAANSGNASYGSPDTAAALDLIPKSVVQANWYYGGAEEHPQLAYFRDKGFEVFPTTWFLAANNYNFVRSAHRLGLDWVAGSSWMYASARSPGMMGELLGEYAWSAERPALDELDYEQFSLMAKWLKPPRPSDVPCEQTPLDISAAMNRSYVDEQQGDEKGWLDLGALRDLSALEPGRRQMGRYLFDIVEPGDGRGCVMVGGPTATLPGIPTSATVPVGRRCDSLVFLHTVNYLNYGPTRVGVYAVRYADGQTVEVPLSNAIDIGPWRRPERFDRWFGKPRLCGHYFRAERAWVGFTRAAEEVDLTACEWVNPRPEVEIAEVTVEASVPGEDGALALLAVTAVTAATTLQEAAQ